MDKDRKPKGYYTDNTGTTALFQPDWDSTFQYAVNDIVFYDGASYKAIQDGSNKNPSSEPTYWTAYPTSYTLPTASTSVLGGVKIDGTSITINNGVISSISLPIGSIVAYSGNSPWPTGFLLCDGSSLLRSGYSALFAVIGTTYGYADDSHFNLPDLREVVLVGVGTRGAGVTAHDVYALGDMRDDQIQDINHYHSISVVTSPSGSGPTITASNYAINSSKNTNAATWNGSYGNPRMGSTTHGKQFGINYLIKFAGGYSEATMPIATASTIGGVKIGANVSVTGDGTISVAAPYALPTASTTVLGGVKVDGTTITIADGVISGANTYSLPVASTTVLGGVKQGANVYIDGTGIISVAAPYTLPTATDTVLGGIKVPIDPALSLTDGSLTANIANNLTRGVVRIGPTLSYMGGSDASLIDVKYAGSGSANSAAHSDHTHSGTYEPILGNPVSDGYILSSTATGVRSWIAPYFYSLPTASTLVLGGVKVDGTSITITEGVISAPYLYSLPIATDAVLGGVIIGDNITVAEDGTISVAAPYTLPIAAGKQLGGVMIGSNVTIDEYGYISVAPPYTLPVATDSILGGVKQGSNVSIDASGVISISSYEPPLGNPDSNGYILASTTTGERSWVEQYSYNLPIAATDTLGGVKIGDGISVALDGTISADIPEPYTLPIATDVVLGGVMVGDNIDVDEDGIISVTFPDAYSLPTASTSVLGGVKVDGTSITIVDGVISGASTYELPVATDSVLGGVKQGSNITIGVDGTISTHAPYSYSLPTASTDTLGGVKIDGTSITIADGVISGASTYSLPVATTSTLGGVKPDGKSIFTDGTGVTSTNVSNSYGPINYITNGNFEQGTTTGWTLYDDAAGYPADGAGGSPTQTFAINSTNPFFGSYDAIYSKPSGNHMGQGVSIDFYIDKTTQANEWMQISFTYKTNAAYKGTSSPYFGVFVVELPDGGGSNLNWPLRFPGGMGNGALVSVIESPVDIPSVYTSYFTPSSSAYSHFRLCIHTCTSDTTAYTLEIDNVFVGVSPISYSSLKNTSELNYFPNGRFEYDMVGWYMSYASTFSISRKKGYASAPLEGGWVGQIIKGGAAQSQTIKYDFELPYFFYNGKTFALIFDYDTTQSSWTGGDIQIQCRDNGHWPYNCTFDGGANTYVNFPTGKGRFRTLITPVGTTNTTDFTLSFIVVNGNSNYDIALITNIVICGVETPYYLASTTGLGGVQPDGTSIGITSSGVISTILAGSGSAVTAAHSDHTHSGYEPALGNPDVDGKVLSSTAAGVRSWVTSGGYSLPTASTTVLGGVKIDGSTVTIADGVISAPYTYTLPSASTSVKGGVKTDGTTTVMSGDVITAPYTYTLPQATDTILGGVKQGSNVTITAGVISVAAPYSLPDATTVIKGGVIVGTGLGVSSGTISVTYSGSGSASSASHSDHTHSGTYEPVLGNPDVDAKVLASTAAGVRSWVTNGGYSLPTASASVLGGVKIGSNVSIDGSGVISVAAPYSLPVATSSVLGGVKQGSNVTIDGSGVISVAAPYSLPTASTTTLGGVKIDGTTVTINTGVISAPYTYTLPAATSSVLGGVKPDGTIITNSSGAITVAQATSSAFGVVKVDNTTITAAAGVISAAVQSGKFVKTTVFTSGTTFTTQASTHTCFVRMVGCGGGGGGGSYSSSNCSVGGGGAAGGYLEKTITVASSTGYTMSFGSGGTAGANTGGTGGTGGDVTINIGGTLLTAKGGLGGVGQTYGTGAAAVLGGLGVVPTNGDVNVLGVSGNPGIRFSGTVGCSGKGGESLFGAGGNSKNAQGAGNNGNGYGSGGGGAIALSAAVAGGVGAGGIIIIDEYT
jgi:microcystin-dependent protein